MPAHSPSPAARLLRGGLLGTAIALVGNVILFAVAGLFGADLVIPERPGAEALAPLSATMVVVATVVPAAGATLLMWGLARFTARPDRAFLIVAAGFLLFSLLPVLRLPGGVTASTRLILAFMHLIAAIGITWGLVVRGLARSTAG